ncbi:MAG: pantetheine-phosphate adenylyltransferase [Elusimicrobia bacterium RIFOXYD2_FULL_34_15]|nr:MAG: pantetheine-phosphate adenylyltransferase [Elusimicrobia bacterium RIFOXYD2_FULL_34_15]
MKRIAVYPGSFDPTTFGHLDIISRSSKIFDKLIIAVITNPNKKPYFSIDERVKILKSSVKEKNVEIESFHGLLVDFMKKKNANVIIRGLRAISDFEYEFQMALTNRKLYPEIETVFLTPAEQWTYLSSTLVKEIARLGGNVKCFVPEIVVKIFKNKR